MMKRISTMLVCCLPLLTSAHTGEGAHTHADDGFTIYHYFTAQEHAVVTWPMVIIPVLALFLYYWKKKAASVKTPSDNA